MSDIVSETYFPDTRGQAVFAADAPQPKFLLETPQLKVVIVGLEAGQQIPLHPSEATMYHFLEGEGLMTIGEETFAIRPGVTVIAPASARRGINARTRLIFLGSKGE